jgi:hypothetical protein
MATNIAVTPIQDVVEIMLLVEYTPKGNRDNNGMDLCGSSIGST